jgi:outer membrane lipoprotein SlyB
MRSRQLKSLENEMKTLAVLPLLLAGLASLTACAAPGNYYGERDHRANGYADSRYPDRYADRGPVRCERCGVVDRIEVNAGDRHTSGGGAVVGALVGGLLGNQVGKGDGRKAATVAGAVAGGFAGNSIERNSRADERYEIYVRLDDGRRLVLTQRNLDGIREGSRVVVNNDRARLL